MFFRALSELPLLPLPPILVTCATFPINPGGKKTFFQGVFPYVHLGRNEFIFEIY